MTQTAMTQAAEGAGAVVLPVAELDLLIRTLKKRGYRVVAPVIQQKALRFGPVESAKELPVGWTDDQGPGTYETREGNDGTVFGMRCGPGSAKEWLYPPQLRLWQAEREGREFRLLPEEAPPPMVALVGLRPCDLAAVRVQDKVFLEGPYADPHYRRRRESTLLVVANCTRSGATCFCASLGTGPRATEGFDLVLTEIRLKEPPKPQRAAKKGEGKGGHVFVVAAGSEEGRVLLAQLGATPAGEAELAAAEEAVRCAENDQKRSIDPSGLKDVLQKNLEHPEWDAVAQRCLACGNCTLVCPTCFCSTVEDVTDLSGQRAERMRKWDSCYTRDFSYIYGGQIRRSIRSRYRQWLTHKLANWQEQFGTLGCVGCGRCITWCPTGIDLTEEVRALRKKGR